MHCVSLLAALLVYSGRGNRVLWALAQVTRQLETEKRLLLERKRREQEERRLKQEELERILKENRRRVSGTGFAFSRLHVGGAVPSCTHSTSELCATPQGTGQHSIHQIHKYAKLFRVMAILSQNDLH